MMETKGLSNFYKETGCKLEVKNGKPYYGGDLDLEDTPLITGGFIKKMRNILTPFYLK